MQMAFLKFISIKLQRKQGYGQVLFRQVLFGGRFRYLLDFWHLYGVIWRKTLTPRRFALVSALG